MRKIQRPNRLAMICASAVAATATALAVGAGTAGAAVAAPAARAVTTAKTVTSSAAAPVYTAPARTLAPGMKGSDVKALQERLSALKYYPGTIDGEFGSNTQAALWAFQEINHVRVTGVVDAATKRALVHPKTYVSPYYRGKRATRIEVSQELEVLLLFDNNNITMISHFSSVGG
jgi:peptidoglycan hydrolase-like protein with peptidoglycan-binding domain